MSSDQLHYDGLIVDLDGVVWLGGEPIDGSVQAIEELRVRGIRIVFVTNNSGRSREEHAAVLTEIGVLASSADVVTSVAAMARFLRSQRGLAGGRVLVIGGPPTIEEFERAGFQLVAAAHGFVPDAVVVAGHIGFDYEELAAATAAVRAGAPLYGTGRDAVYPTPEGLLPATGAILAAVEVASGVTATVIGKPEPFIFEVARESLVACERVAVVGDHLISDISGARKAGLGAILVLTGAATRDELEGAAIQPDLVVPNLAALVEGARGAAAGASRAPRQG
jgi:HAD superfamily hydrolase (TIGR01450 family)